MALGGVTGKVVFFVLKSGEVNIETPDEQIYKDYLGGILIAERRAPSHGALPLFHPAAFPERAPRWSRIEKVTLSSRR